MRYIDPLAHTAAQGAAQGDKQLAARCLDHRVTWHTYTGKVR